MTQGDATAILRHWIEAVPHDRLAHLVKDATRAFVRALSMRLAEEGVSFGHWTYLRILWEHDGLTQKQLSDEAGVMEPTTYAAVTAMERAGYVRREQRPGNRKNVHVSLTPRGRALKRRLVPLAEEVNRIGVARIDAASVAAVRRVLITVIANLAQDELQRAATASTAPARARPATRGCAPAGSRRPTAAARGSRPASPRSRRSEAAD
jgi:DNA-binding MarR family transcriptional regulator